MAPNFENNIAHDAGDGGFMLVIPERRSLIVARDDLLDDDCNVATSPTSNTSSSLRGGTHQRHRRQPSAGFTPKYEIGELLGQGAFGVVEICHQRVVSESHSNRIESNSIMSRSESDPGCTSNRAAASNEYEGEQQQVMWPVDSPQEQQQQQTAQETAEDTAQETAQGTAQEPEVAAAAAQRAAQEAAIDTILRPRQKGRDVTQRWPAVPSIRRSSSLEGPQPTAERHVESFACKTVHKTRSFSDEGIRYEEANGVRYIEDDTAQAHIRRLRMTALSNEIRALKHVGSHRHIVAMKGVYDNAHRTRLLLELCDAGDLLTLLRNYQQRRATNSPAKPRLWSPINRAAAAVAAVAAAVPAAVVSSGSPNRQGLPEKLTADIFRQLVVGVRHCHRRHVIHRDIKLENVLLCHNTPQEQQRQRGDLQRGNSLRIDDARRAALNPDRSSSSSSSLKGRQNQQAQWQHQQMRPIPDHKGKSQPLQHPQQQHRQKQQQHHGRQGSQDLRQEGPYTVKLADFGLALILPANGFATGNVGTRLYKAPEVAKGRWYTTKADMWSLGVVLYVLLSGQYPRTDIETGAILDFAPEVLFSDQIWNHVSPSAVSLVAAMMSRDPSKRPSCKEILQHPWLSPEPPLTIENAFRRLIRGGSLNDRKEMQ
ncbi:hypothetical protein CLOM_g2009 [Closterium sp. NIES-68]|nr:hypothetical protein CLOM_g2009 [Closterium sp. NIES-68]GJP62638.1 hypothetical protein CLOP_g19674 [Closterium sp. NIES-67]GJP66379.1 hypothetical protein CLOP_g23312 [Closterium sp. NIES-67]